MEILALEKLRHASVEVLDLRYISEWKRGGLAYTSET
jgi:hypothetical protein